MTSTPMLRAAFLLIAASLLAGCGGRTLDVPVGDGGTSANSNQNANQNNNGNNNNPNPECQRTEDCRLAVKWDECCPCPAPASQRDLNADPCLIPLEQSYVPEECFVDCPAIPCEVCPDYGRSVACLNGECMWAEGRCTDDTQCIAAVRVDNCCQPAFPATHDDVAADPCLVYWPLWWEQIPEVCYEQWDPECALIDCAPSPPRSRAMVCEQNMCGYEPECQDPSDCMLLMDSRQCCSCPEPWPASMADHDPCLVRPWTQPPGYCRPDTCYGVLCEECPPDPGMDCVDEGVCVPVYWY